VTPGLVLSLHYRQSILGLWWVPGPFFREEKSLEKKSLETGAGVFSTFGFRV
jgi:hypothetical protein